MVSSAVTIRALLRGGRVGDLVYVRITKVTLLSAWTVIA